MVAIVKITQKNSNKNKFKGELFLFRFRRLEFFKTIPPVTLVYVTILNCYGPLSY